MASNQSKKPSKIKTKNESSNQQKGQSRSREIIAYCLGGFGGIILAYAAIFDHSTSIWVMYFGSVVVLSGLATYAHGHFKSYILYTVAGAFVLCGFIITYVFQLKVDQKNPPEQIVQKIEKEPNSTSEQKYRDRESKVNTTFISKTDTIYVINKENGAQINPLNIGMKRSPYEINYLLGDTVGTYSSLFKSMHPFRSDTGLPLSSNVLPNWYSNPYSTNKTDNPSVYHSINSYKSILSDTPSFHVITFSNPVQLLNLDTGVSNIFSSYLRKASKPYAINNFDSLSIFRPINSNKLISNIFNDTTDLLKSDYMDLLRPTVSFDVIKKNSPHNNALVSEVLVIAIPKKNSITTTFNTLNIRIKIIGTSIISLKASNEFLSSGYVSEIYPSGLRDDNNYSYGIIGKPSNHEPHVDIKSANGKYKIEILHSKEENFECKYEIIF